jgi:hypothetical protein
MRSCCIALIRQRLLGLFSLIEQVHVYLLKVHSLSILMSAVLEKPMVCSLLAIIVMYFIDVLAVLDEIFVVLVLLTLPMISGGINKHNNAIGHVSYLSLPFIC